MEITILTLVFNLVTGAIFAWAMGNACKTTPAVFVIGRRSLTQHLYIGSFLWFWCASSAGTEKPKETTRRPLESSGSKTCRHGTVAGVTIHRRIKIKAIDSLPFYSPIYRNAPTSNRRERLVSPEVCFSCH